MYERFYNLRERPFSLSPDPDYLYLSRVHREAMSHLQFGIEEQAGFIVLTGEIGSGKTTLLQAALRRLDRQTSVSRIVNTLLDGRDLIEAVMLDFGLDVGERKSKPQLLHELARYLVDQRSSGRLALLVIDEAQNLSLPALEEVRMLSNLETEKSKLIQVVLVGQPNLRAILARTDLEQLRQRVTVSYHLQPLDAAETAAYIGHRLRHAALGAPLELPRVVTDLIHHHGEGIPRKINVIADAVLLFGYSEDCHFIDAALTASAIRELEESGVIAPIAAQAPSLTPAARQATVAPPTQQAGRDAELAQREARLVERERQLVEHQRVLVEQYRILKGRAPLPDAAPAPIPPWPPPAPASVATPPAPVEASRVDNPLPSTPPARSIDLPIGRTQPATTLTPTRVLPPQPIIRPERSTVMHRPADGLWMRMRRALFGMSKPAVGD